MFLHGEYFLYRNYDSLGINCQAAHRRRPSMLIFPERNIFSKCDDLLLRFAPPPKIGTLRRGDHGGRTDRRRIDDPTRSGAQSAAIAEGLEPGGSQPPLGAADLEPVEGRERQNGSHPGKAPTG